eukprot:3947123-Pyramimonas_sp.AAC.1
MAQHEPCPTFWLRRLMPRAWTTTPQSVTEERWVFDGNTMSGVGVLGEGTFDEPILICGGASGGPDTISGEWERRS